MFRLPFKPDAKRERNEVSDNARVRDVPEEFLPVPVGGAGEKSMALGLTWAGSAANADDALALRGGAGDLAAFDTLVANYQTRLFRFAYRMLKNRVEAEDVVQETFLRAYRALPKYRPDGYFSSWIYRIALNECRRRMRGQRPTVELEAGMYADETAHPEQTLLSQDRNRRLREAVEALPEHYRLVMQFFYFEEMSVDQISRALDVSVSAVKVRLHRGRERLATRLGDSF
jgi:RNA polymerase sigma-70 factor (ECF subfamily)